MDIIAKIGACLVKVIDDAAWRSYHDGENACSYDGCSAEVTLSPQSSVYVWHDPRSGFHVETAHESNQETPNFDKAIIACLEDNAAPEAEWQEARGNDDHDDTTLDEGFGSWQDYYDYMYN